MYIKRLFVHYSTRSFSYHIVCPNYEHNLRSISSNTRISRLITEEDLVPRDGPQCRFWLHAISYQLSHGEELQIPIPRYRLSAQPRCRIADSGSTLSAISHSAKMQILVPRCQLSATVQNCRFWFHAICYQPQCRIADSGSTLSAISHSADSGSTLSAITHTADSGSMLSGISLSAELQILVPRYQLSATVQNGRFWFHAGSLL
jgi:hypothetical protein